MSGRVTVGRDRHDRSVPKKVVFALDSSHLLTRLEVDLSIADIVVRTSAGMLPLGFLYQDVRIRQKRVAARVVVVEDGS